MKFVKHVSEVPRVTSRRLSTGETLGSVANLSQTTGLENLVIHHEILPPGHRSSPPHKHSRKEEFIYVIEGTPSVWIGGDIRDLHDGDAVGFPAGTAHMVFNRSSTPAQLVVVSTVPAEEDRCTFIEEDPFPFLVAGGGPGGAIYP